MMASKSEQRSLSLRMHICMWLAICCLGACSHSTTSPKLFESMTNTGIEFTNTITDSKTENSFYFRNFYNGGGVAIGDLNNDGLPEVVLSSNMGENKLYQNKGGWKFEDISMKAGLRQDSMWSTGIALADVNADGWLDIYICSSGHINGGPRRNKLYINNHNLTFTESAASFGLDHSGFSTQASFFDYDMDGDLDCLLIDNSPIPFSSLNYANMRDLDIDRWKVSDNLKGGGNHLFRNDNNKFTEVTKEAGLHTGLLSFGLGVSVSDINGDGYPDIYVGNDFIERDYLYINQRNGTFRDELEQHVQQLSMSSMSTDIADINNDGYPDLFTTDMMPDNDYRLKTTGTFDNYDLYASKQKSGLYHQFVKNALQLNNGNNTFSEVSAFSGVQASDWSWGSIFFDADNDGYNDIFICNGINRDLGDLDFLDFISNDIYQEALQTGKKEEIGEILKRIPGKPLPNKMYRNLGNLKFADVSNEWGLGEPSFSNSVAYGDLDNDGDLDLVVNNVNMPAFIYKNKSTELNRSSSVSIQLTGDSLNHFAVGACIRLFTRNGIMSREINPSRGFQSSMDYRQVIGLGEKNSIDSLQVRWPDRTTSVIKNIKPGDRLKLDARKLARTAPFQVRETESEPIVSAYPSPLEKHIENDFVDFYAERNIPEMLSREGPRIAIADVNGDGQEDVFIGGGKGQAGQLLLQSGGVFKPSVQGVFQQFAAFEDVATLFFDADGDGDMDLYVGAGGNELPPNSREMQHRLYINDGKGNFSIDASAFPANDMNISVATAADFDSDGDQDLFIGSLSVPGAYGVTPRSYLVQNDGHGHFTDVTHDVCPGLENAGMISAAQWLKVDNKLALVVTGEWMSPTMFVFNNGHGKELKTEMSGLSGLWHSLAVADMNGDGRQDIILGNVGENFNLQPDSLHPVKLWLADFDHNGKVEPFLTRTIDNRDMPVFLKRDVTEQFPALKKENLHHKDYAGKSVQDLFGQAVMKEATMKPFNFCSSIIAYSLGNGRYKIERLPARTQFSTTNAICATDLNYDGKPDLLMGGNNYNFQPQFGRLDASYGDVLINAGNGKFLPASPTQSGLSITGEVKDIKPLKVNGRNLFVITRNNEQPLMFELNEQIKKEKY